jgi:hypothetical protein
MIRYLILLYLGVISIVLIDPNPLWSLPLIFVLIGSLLKRRWLTLLGILLFSTITLGRVDHGSFTDLPDLIVLTLGIVLPLVILLEASLAPQPYRIQRISLIPTVISIGMIIGFFSVLFLLANIRRIGVYLSSDPILQVFILMALALFFTAPVLLGSSPPEKENRPRGGNSQPRTIKTNK